MTALIQLYLASVKEFVRDRMAMFWTLAFPVMFIFIFGLVFSGGGDPSYELGIAVEDDGPIGRALADVFGSVDAFEVSEGARDDLLKKLEDGDLRAVIVIPAGMSAAVVGGEPVAVAVYHDPSSQTTAQIVLTIIERVIEGFDRSVTGSPQLLTIEPIAVTSDRMSNLDFLLPGILGMSLMQLGLFGTAPQIVQLREQQVLRRIGATPLPRAVLLASQVMLRITIGATQTALILIVGVLIFDVTIVGNVAALAGVALLGALMFVAMGYMVAGFARTQESVAGISQMINFPMMFLSGIFFPLEFMPAWLRPVVNALPLTYLADALRQIMVGAAPLFSLGLDVLVVVAWLVGCATLAVRYFRWE